MGRVECERFRLSNEIPPERVICECCWLLANVYCHWLRLMFERKCYIDGVRNPQFENLNRCFYFPFSFANLNKFLFLFFFFFLLCVLWCATLVFRVMLGILCVWMRSMFTPQQRRAPGLDDAVRPKNKIVCATVVSCPNWTRWKHWQSLTLYACLLVVSWASFDYAKNIFGIVVSSRTHEILTRSHVPLRLRTYIFGV